jgi:hypothetical protein
MGHGTADNPAHTVNLSDFWIYATEVTNYQYSICVDQGRCAPPDPIDNPEFLAFDSHNRPVVGVTYDQARAYCDYMNADLPTEAQWEKAARGTAAPKYPWGDAAPSCDLLNFENCVGHTDDVTSKPDGASSYGALHMAGNVYEWTADWYDAVYYQNSPPGDPPGPGSGRARVIRSSGSRSNASQSLAYARSYAAPGDHRRDLGFRCAVGDPSDFAPACQLARSIDFAEAGRLAVDCPEISIDVHVTACRYGGGALVTFNNDHPEDPNASFGGIVGCTLAAGRPGAYPLSYECRHASTAVLSSSCTFSGKVAGSCPPHYGLDSESGVCQWDGTRTTGIDCPTGEFYDPVQYCCRISSGSLPDFPVCPAGSVFAQNVAEGYACLPSGIARTVPLQTESVAPPVCPDSCELTVELCAVRNLVFCATTCNCLAVGRTCPGP